MSEPTTPARAENVAFHVTAKALLWVRPERPDFRYVWGAHETPLSMDGARVSSVEIDDHIGWGDAAQWFLFYCADCAWPSFHAILSTTFKSAYELFIDQEAERGQYVIADGDPDYGSDDGSFASDGTRVDTECFQGFEVTLRSVDAAD